MTTGGPPEAAENSADELTGAPAGEHRVDPDDVPADPDPDPDPDWEPARATEPDPR